MRSSLRSTVILLIIFLSLAAYVYFIKSDQPTSAISEPREKVFSVESDAIVELTIKNNFDETTTLAKVDDVWHITNPILADAEETEAAAITTSLASLEIQRIIEEEPTSLEPFGLAEPRIDVTFRLAEQIEPQRLLIGETTPTGGDLYTTIAGENRVFLISSFLENTYNRTTFDLRDKTILKFNQNEIDAIEIAGKAMVELEKSENAWTLTAPWQARGDYGTIEALVGQLSTAQMQSIEAEASDELDHFGLEKPATTITLSTGNSQSTLFIGNESSNGTFYAQDIARDLIFTIDSTLVADLGKEADTYRKKDLFDFRPFNAKQLEVTQHGDTFVFEKTVKSGSDEETWQQIQPTQDSVDQDQINTLLTKLSNLRAQSFTEFAANNGFELPTTTVSVIFNEPEEKESVTFGTQNNVTFGRHNNEVGAVRLDSQQFNEVLEALEALE